MYAKQKTKCTLCGHETEHSYSMPLGPLSASGAVVHEDASKPVCRSCQCKMIDGLVLVATLQHPVHGPDMTSLIVKSMAAVFNGECIPEPDLTEPTEYPVPLELGNELKKCLLCGKLFQPPDGEHWHLHCSDGCAFFPGSLLWKDN